MTRQRDVAAGLFHVTCHSVWDGLLYRDDIDRTNYVDELARTTAKVDWKCVSVCLMTTHVHLILDVADGTLPVGMEQLNFRFATRFNARHRRRGRVFGAPYGAHRIFDDPHLLTVYRYVARNPEEAGVVDRPEDWIWSSYRAAIGLNDSFTFVDPGRVLGCFGGTREIAIARLRAFVGKT
jgi:REP-associated tyrosine transposase